MQPFHSPVVPFNSVAGERILRASRLTGLDSAAPVARRVPQAGWPAPYAAAASRREQARLLVYGNPGRSGGGADREADGYYTVHMGASFLWTFGWLHSSTKRSTPHSS